MRTTTDLPTDHRPRQPHAHEGTAKRLENIGYEPVGGPFDPNQIATTRALPASIFSSVILVPMLICRAQRTEFHFIVTLLIPQYVSYLLCVAIQGTFLFYVRTLVSDKDTSISDVVCNAPKEGVSSVLRLICMSLSVAAVLKDVGETISMHTWLNSIPRWTEEQQDILEYTCKTSGLTDFPFQKYKNDDGMELLKPAVGMTMRSTLISEGTAGVDGGRVGEGGGACGGGDAGGCGPA